MALVNCANCGYDNDLEGKYCSQCHRMIIGSVEEESYSEGWRSGFGVGLVVATLACIGLGIAGYFLIGGC